MNDSWFYAAAAFAVALMVGGEIYQRYVKPWIETWTK